MNVNVNVNVECLWFRPIKADMIIIFDWFFDFNAIEIYIYLHTFQSSEVNDSKNANAVTLVVPKNEEKRRRSSEESSISAITISSSDSGIGSNEENLLNFKLR